MAVEIGWLDGEDHVCPVPYRDVKQPHHRHKLYAIWVCPECRERWVFVGYNLWRPGELFVPEKEWLARNPTPAPPDPGLSGWFRRRRSRA